MKKWISEIAVRNIRCALYLFCFCKSVHVRMRLKLSTLTDDGAYTVNTAQKKQSSNMHKRKKVSVTQPNARTHAHTGIPASQQCVF